MVGFFALNVPAGASVCFVVFLCVVWCVCVLCCVWRRHCGDASQQTGSLGCAAVRHTPLPATNSPVRTTRRLHPALLCVCVRVCVPQAWASTTSATPFSRQSRRSGCASWAAPTSRWDGVRCGGSGVARGDVCRVQRCLPVPVWRQHTGAGGFRPTKQACLLPMLCRVRTHTYTRTRR
jgi:hypothetical protein